MFVRITSKKIPVFEPAQFISIKKDFFRLKLQNSVTPDYHTGNMEFRVSLWVIREGKKNLPLCTALSSTIKKEAECTLETGSE